MVSFPIERAQAEPHAADEYVLEGREGESQHAGKLLKKELGTVGRVVGRVAEPGFSRRKDGACYI